MSSRKRKTMDNKDNSAAPPKKRVKIDPKTKSPSKAKKPVLARGWTRTNPETGEKDGPRLYKLDTIAKIHSKHRRRRTEHQQKKKSGKNKSKAKKAKKSKEETKEDESKDYSSLTRRFVSHVVVVTGAGESIGQAIAVRFAQEGAIVYVLDSYKYNETIDLCNNMGKAPTSSELEAEEEEEDDLPVYTGIKCDVTNMKDVQKAIKQIMSERGYIDVLVNAAFKHKGDGKIVEDVTSNDLEKVMNVNFNGTFNLCKTVLPYMSVENYGRVVNIVSSAGVNAKVGTFVEASAAAAVIAGTKAMGDDYARVGVTCNCVSASYFDHPKWKLAVPEGVDEIDHIEQVIPLGRNGELGEIAGMVAFAASEENSYSTGKVFHCDGGL